MMIYEQYDRLYMKSYTKFSRTEGSLEFMLIKLRRKIIDKHQYTKNVLNKPKQPSQSFIYKLEIENKLYSILNTDKIAKRSIK